MVAIGDVVVVEGGGAEPDAGRVLRLYEVDERGATSWVLAVSPGDAVEALLAGYGYEDATDDAIAFDLGWSRGDPPEVEAVSRERARKLWVRLDDGSSRSALDVVQQEPRRGVIATTEW